MFALAHLSDPHLAGWSVDRPAALANKRITGWLSWRLNRHKIHLARVLDLMQADMAEQPIDHVAVTGDLVNISLPQEFEGAARWLRTLGPRQQGHGHSRQSRRLCRGRRTTKASAAGATT